jgi:uncharacterized membrane protein
MNSPMLPSSVLKSFIKFIIIFLSEICNNRVVTLTLPSLARSLVLFCISLSIFLTLAVPPFQKPDEIVHFYKSVSVAQGRLWCGRDAEGVFQNRIPSYLKDFPVTTFAEHIAHKPHIPFPVGLYARLIVSSYDTQSQVNEPGSCFLPFFLYAPTGLAMAVPIALRANPLFIFYLGRMANVCLALFLMGYAWKISKYHHRLWLLMIAILPMTLFQIGSYSKDALHLGAGIVALAILVRSVSEPKSVSVKMMLTFFASLAVTILARPQFALFALLPLLIVKPHIKKIPQSWRIMSVLFLVGLFGLIFLLFNNEIYSAKALSLGNVAPNSFIYPQAQLLFLWEHPSKILSVVTTTFAAQYLFLGKSLIGLLGWLDYELPWYIYLAFIFSLFGIFRLVKDHLPKLNWQRFLVLSAVVWGTVLAVLLAMYLYATPVAGSQVRGLQGRYFILLIPLLAWWTAQLLNWLGKRIYILYGSLLLLSVINVTLVRYYSPNNYFYANDEKAFDYEEIASERTSEVGNGVIISLPLEPAKKLTGFRVLPLPTLVKVNKPHVARVFDSTCVNLIHEVVIDATDLKAYTTFDIRFPAISGDEYSHVCVKLEPYHFTVTKDESLLLMQTPQGSPLLPLYLF